MPEAIPQDSMASKYASYASISLSFHSGAGAGAGAAAVELPSIDAAALRWSN